MSVLTAGLGRTGSVRLLAEQAPELVPVRWGG
jgi:hypothetical protein